MNSGFFFALLYVVLMPLTSVLLTKIAREKGSLVISFYRQFGIAIAGVLIFLFVQFPFDLIRESFLEISLACLFGAAFVFISFYGMNFIPIGIANIYRSISRVAISVGIGLFVLGETLSVGQMLGTLLILGGVLSLKPSSIDVSHLRSKNQLFGIGIAMFSGILITLSFYFFRLYANNLDPLVAAYILETGIGAILLLGLSVYSIHQRILPTISLKSSLSIIALAPLILIGTWGIARAYDFLSFSIVQVISSLSLVVFFIFGWLLLNERIKTREILIFIIMIAGLVLLSI